MDPDISPNKDTRQEGENLKIESSNSSKPLHGIDCLKSSVILKISDDDDLNLNLYFIDSNKKIEGDTGKLETPDSIPDVPVSEEGKSNSDDDPSSVIEKSAREAWLDKIGIRGNVAPKFPHYSEFKDRLKSFKLWTSHSRQKPTTLSEAGFFFIGVADRTACFHCGGGLREWKSTDDPWIEHAHWFPKCTFVRNIKGQEFIDQAWRSKLNTNSSTAKEMKDAADALKDLIDVIGPKLRNNLQKEKFSSPQHTNLKIIQSENETFFTCRICFAEERNVIFLPCQHVVSCGKCASRVKQCMVCRKLITDTMRAIFA